MIKKATKMRKVAIIEDEKKSADLLKGYFSRYEEKYKQSFEVVWFQEAASFLNNYQPIYDIVLMDIELPGINGIKASEELRKKDPVVTLIFVTNMAQFAVKGYEVQAFNFMVKPVSYGNFELNIKKVLAHLSENKECELLVSYPGGVVRILSSTIKYIEVKGHHLSYHTENGTIETSGTLKKVENQLSSAHFVRCNSFYLVNLKFVSGIDGYWAHVGGEKLAISRPKRMLFMQALNHYLGGEA
jgi:two-component system response regulator LytT